MKLLSNITIFIFTSLTLILLSPIIIIVLIYNGLDSIFSRPRVAREKTELLEAYNKLRDTSGITAYIHYDRNLKISDYIETELLPKYKDHLIFSYGEDFTRTIPKEYERLVELLEQYAKFEDTEELQNTSDDVYFGAVLYAYSKEKMQFSKWQAVSADDDTLDVKMTKRLFEKKIEESILALS